MTTTFEIKPEDVLNLAAQKLADNVSDSSEIFESANRLIRERVDAAMKETINRKIDAILNGALDEMMSQVISPVNVWGEKTGEPTTIRDTLNAKAKEFWATLVDSNGAAVKPDSWSRNGKPRAEWLIGKVLQDEFMSLVKNNTAEILVAMKEKLRADALASVNRHLDELIKVKTR